MPTTLPAQRTGMEKDPRKVTTTDTPATDNNEATGTLNSPKLNEKGKPTQRAVTTAKQAWTIAKRHRDTAVEGRIKKAALIASKYDGDAPFSAAELRATGQSWRNNFSTNFMASLIDRVTPQLTDPANKTDLLTRSSLPKTYPDGATKSRKFQEATTQTIRKWEKWKDLLSGLAKEIVLYGNACPMRVDKNWRPKLWGFGESFLPEGTGQHAKDVQVAVAYQSLLLHEFIQLFQDDEVAKRANYNIPGCVEIANRTTGAGESGPNDPTALDKQDMMREGGTMGWSYENPNKTVNLMHVLVRDYTGEVDLWTVDAEKGTEVRHEIALHERIEDGVTLFTFQSGNRKYYGSKGLGRLEANLHTAIERGRNLGADQMYLSGLIIWEGDPKDTTIAQCKVKHPFVVVKAGVKLVTQQVVFNAEAFEIMDKKLTSIAESIAGAFIPPNLDGEGSSNTKIEAAQKAERDIAVREGVLGRFFDHLSELVTMMQRGIYSVDNIREAVRIYKDKKAKMESGGIKVIWRKVWNVLKKCKAALDRTEPTLPIVAADEDAVECIVGLMEDGLNEEEIVTLAMEPAGANTSGEGTEKDNQTIAVLNDNKAAPSPFIDQRHAEEMRLKLLVGEDRAEILLIPEDDPSVKARASNWQKQEIAQMVDGVSMDVPKDDNHIVHREVLGPQLGDLIHVLQTAPTIPLIKAASLMLDHYRQHMAYDTVTTDQAKQQEDGVMSSWEQVINKATAAMEKRAQEIAAAGGKMGPDGNPIPVQGKPMQVGADGAMIGEGSTDDPTLVTPDHRISATATAAEIAARQTDQALTARKLALEESKHQHQVGKDAIQLQQTNMQMLQAQAQHTDHLAQEDADRDLAKTMAEQAAKTLPAKS